MLDLPLLFCEIFVIFFEKRLVEFDEVRVGEVELKIFLFFLFSTREVHAVLESDADETDKNDES